MNLHDVLTEMCKEHIKIKKGGYADLLYFNLKSKTIKNGNKEESVKAQKQLKDTLVSLTPLFQHYPYFMSETFSILDCMLAPIFLRLPTMGIHLPPQHCRPILLYMQRIFSRPAFLKSLTLQEKNHYRELLKNI